VQPSIGRRSLVLSLAAATAFLVLAVLVRQGAMIGFDRFSVDHLSPLAHGPRRHQSSLVQFLNTPLTVAVGVAAPATSLLLAAAGCLELLRRGRPWRAYWWAIGLAVGLLIELTGKLVIGDETVTGVFRADRADFPSGHAIRAVLLTGLACELWPSGRRAFLAAALVIFAGLQMKQVHPPSDLVGGLLAGLAIYAALRVPQNPA
jgi:hypothetical protein